MPVRHWKHRCLEGRQETSFAASPCACGTPKIYDGWHNTSLESMAWTQKFTGLKCAGAHLDLQARLFEGTTKPCSDCEGRGYLDVGAASGFQVCPICDGAGYVSSIGAERRAALRAEVLACFPYAAAPQDLPNPAFHTVIYDQTQCVVLVIPPARSA